MADINVKKLALRSADLLTFLEHRQAQTAAAIDAIRALMADAGVAPNATRPSRRARRPQDATSKLEAAQAMFEQSHGPRKPAKPSRTKGRRKAKAKAKLELLKPRRGKNGRAKRMNGDGRYDLLVQFVNDTGRDQELTARQIATAIGLHPTNGGIYALLDRAVKENRIVRTGDVMKRRYTAA